MNVFAGKGIANTGEIFDRIMSIDVRSIFFSLKHQIPAILTTGVALPVDGGVVA